MNALFVFAIFAVVAGTNAGYLSQPAVYAAPVAVASPVLTATYPTYSVNSPAVSHIGSSYAAPAYAAYAAPTYGAYGGSAFVAPVVKSFASPYAYAGAYSHHYSAPSYGFALRK